jgi:hypothetical protein
VLAGAALAYLANMAGWWPATLAVGIAIALAVRRQPVLWAALTGAVSWGAGLAVDSQQGSTARIAQVAGSLAGLGTHAAPYVMAVTVVLGALLCLAGAWLCTSARMLARAIAASPGAAPAEAVPGPAAGAQVAAIEGSNNG